MKAIIIDRYSIRVIDYDKEKAKIDSFYNQILEKEEVTDEVIQKILKKKDTKRTEEELLKIITRKTIEDEYAEKLSKLEVYKDYYPSSYKGELSETESVRPYYIEEGESVLQKWEVVKDSPSAISEKIKALKEELSEGDYKIIKLYEAKLADQPEPYDSESLLKERQEIRNKINQLESKLDSNSGKVEQLRKKV